MPSESKPTLLYCHLTDSHLAWTVAAVDMHITGRKYIRALWAWREGCGKTEVEKTFSPVKGRKSFGLGPLKLNGIPTPVGAKKYFSSPTKTPKTVPARFNYDEFQSPGKALSAARPVC